MRFVPRRYRSFSLRSLLVLVTLFCAWLGIVANQALRQRRAVAVLRALGPRAEFVFADDVPRPLNEPHALEELHFSVRPGIGRGPAVPEWMLSLCGEGSFRRLAYVQLNGQDPADFAPGLQAIAGLKTIVRVDLDGANATEVGADHIRKLATLPSLRAVCFRDCKLSRGALGELAKLTQLEVLTFGDAEVDPGPYVSKLEHLHWLRMSPCIKSSGQGASDATLTALGRLASLEHLWLDLSASRLAGTKIADTGLSALAKLTCLRELRLEHADNGDRALFFLGSLPALEKLTLWDCEITDQGLEALAPLPRLRELELSATKVEGRGLGALAACPLERLKISVCPLSASQLACLGRLSNLQTLSFDDPINTDFGDQELAVVATLPKLRELEVCHSRVTAAGLAVLPGMANLEWLALPSSAAIGGLSHLKSCGRLWFVIIDFQDPRAVPTLRAALPKVRISQTGPMGSM